eukprot:2918291-Rhodomonas_salina.2
MHLHVAVGPETAQYGLRDQHIAPALRRLALREAVGVPGQPDAEAAVRTLPRGQEPRSLSALALAIHSPVQTLPPHTALCGLATRSRCGADVARPGPVTHHEDPLGSPPSSTLLGSPLATDPSRSVLAGTDPAARSPAAESVGAERPTRNQLGLDGEGEHEPHSRNAKAYRRSPPYAKRQVRRPVPARVSVGAAGH